MPGAGRAAGVPAPARSARAAEGLPAAPVPPLGDLVGFLSRGFLPSCQLGAGETRGGRPGSGAARLCLPRAGARQPAGAPPAPSLALPINKGFSEEPKPLEGAGAQPAAPPHCPRGASDRPLLREARPAALRGAPGGAAAPSGTGLGSDSPDEAGPGSAVTPRRSWHPAPHCWALPRSLSHRTGRRKLSWGVALPGRQGREKLL